MVSEAKSNIFPIGNGEKTLGASEATLTMNNNEHENPNAPTLVIMRCPHRMGQVEHDVPDTSGYPRIVYFDIV